MKQIFILAITISLLFLVSASGLAVVILPTGGTHDAYGDFRNFAFVGNVPSIETFLIDKWFTIDQQTPFYQVAVNQGSSSLPVNSWQLNGLYYCNDQTFIEGFIGDANIGISAFKGSFLTQSGFFLGFDYESDLLNSITIAPGYRFGFGDLNYIALSLDYNIEDLGGSAEREVEGYDVDFKYFTDNYKLFGQILFDVPDDGINLDLGLNYKISNELVLGFIVEKYVDEDATLGVGLTYQPDFMTLDFVTTSDGEDNSYAISGMFNLDKNLRGGLGFGREDASELEVYLKAVYSFDIGDLKFVFRAPNSDFGSLFYVGYQKDFK